MTIETRLANLDSQADAAAIICVLDSYASDPRGGSTPLPTEVKDRLIPGLKSYPTARIWLAFDAGQAIGLCVGFLGFSTFRAQPLINIHDLAVVPGRRGGGVGRALLTAAENHARSSGCCKLTLEVQEDNHPARTLYESFGFRDVVYGDSGPTRFLAKTLEC